MGDTTITIIAIFLAAILMFVFPLMTLSDRSDDVANLSVQTITSEFVDNVKKTGKLTEENYSKLVEQISSTGNSYDVEVTAPDGGVNMRCGAGVEYDKVLPDMIPNGTVLTVTQEAVASNGNSWGYTNYNGTYGWIALTQVTKYEEPTEGAPIPHTRYVINCNESITLRTNPDVNAAEICQIPLGTAVATFGDAGNGFISVYYQGSSGYCLASYLSAPVD